MLTGENFVVSLTELPSEVGDISESDAYTVNYYSDYNFRGTMCCNCDKVEQEQDATL